ncbi:MAG: ATPase, T2SS/T4P/T4SS family [Desulfosalsimonadaceae bacterium]
MASHKIENPRFFKLLEENQIISGEFVRDLLDELEGNALDVLATLIQSGVGTKRSLCQLWCDSIGIAHVDLEKSLFQPHVVRRLPERFARMNYAIPVYQMGDTVTVATSTPDNKYLKKQIQQLIDAPVNLVFALPADVEWAIENEYRTNTALSEFFAKIAAGRVFGATSPISEKTFEEVAGKESIQQFHVCLILLGITENISEIEIDPEEHVTKIHFIVNNTFQERLRIEKPVYERLLTQLQTMAHLPDSLDDAPQYSRILFSAPGKKFHIQFLSLPGDFGRKIFLKFMDRSPLERLPKLSELYLSQKHTLSLTNAIDVRKGVMLVSAPEQASFTDLAYALINELQSSGAGRIMTVEDSLRWLFKDIEQHQVNPKAPVTRADALKTCLNHHPDVIYIQNINDPEISDAIREAAESGQFFLAGIEAADALEALALTSPAIGPVLSVIVNQQPVRRLCDHCKEKYPLSFKEMDDLFIYQGAPRIYAWREKGCPYCKHTGFAGQIGIYEVLVISPELRELITRNESLKEIQMKIRLLGFTDKTHDGIKKVLRGLTTLQEIETLRRS